MAKVKGATSRSVDDVSSAAMAAGAAGAGGVSRRKEMTRSDETGRAITVRTIGPLDRMRLFKIVGPENAKNMQYLEYAAIACSVIRIDDIDYNFPTSIMQIEARVQQLDDVGIEAAGMALKELLGIVDGDEADSDVAAAAKN